MSTSETPTAPDVPPGAGDSVPREPLGFLADRLESQVNRFGQALDRLEADPLDMEAVHDTRVACRRLRVGLSVVRPELGRKRPARRLGARLSELRGVLGAARETEVGQVTLKTLRPRLSGDERLTADALAAFLSVQNEELRQETAKRLQALDPGKLRRQLDRLVSRLKRRTVDDAAVAVRKGGSEDADALGALALAQVRGRRIRWLDLPIEPLVAGNDPALHRCRIDAKKLRYTLEFFEPLFVPAVSGRLRLLRELQDRLGDAHDLADLGRRLHGLARAAHRIEEARLAIGYEALADLVEGTRRTSLAGFARLRAGVAHEAFVPALRAAEPSGAELPAEDVTPPASAEPPEPGAQEEGAA